MAEPFIAEIRIFAGNFAPRGWAFCHGQLMPISQNTALFSLVGTTYGGDGRTSFGLPDLQGRAPMHPGNGPGLSVRRLGEKSGSSTVALTPAQMPAHTHALQASDQPASTNQPGGNLPAVTREDCFSAAGTPAPMRADALTPTGGGQAHNNMQPFLALYFIIALTGLFPSRS
jgi:microcystin-dependent protein